MSDILSVGIDLGTTYSAVAYIDPKTKQPEVIKNKYGFNTTPSAVVFYPDSSVGIGIDAKNAEESGDPNTASFYKLEMGSKDFCVEFFGKSYTASDISGLFLRELIAQAEKRVGQKIGKAVITVPAYFEDPERNATMRAGEAAGLQVINIINEPTAAAIAYGLKNGGAGKNILIYDLGGGTFDVTIAKLTEDSIDVIGSAGKHFLGGKNWDEAISHWAADRFEEEYGVSPVNDPDEFNILMIRAEKAKRILSSSPYADINVEYGGFAGKYRLTEAEFRDCTDSLLDITRRTIDELLTDIGMTMDDIDGVILVGGSTRMKMVRDSVTEMTGKAPLSGVHPDEAVAIGAAIEAGIDKYCAKGGAPLGFLEGDTAAYELEALPGAKYVNDVAVHSLGMISVSEDGSRFINDIMIRKNTPIKNASVTKRRELSVGRSEEKNELEIYMLQGGCEDPADCTAAKRCRFTGIAYVEGGRSQIDITYSYTVNATISIEAVQTETNKKLACEQLPIPEDMSWVKKKPDEHFRTFGAFGAATGALYLALDVSESMSVSSESTGLRIGKGKTAMKLAQQAMKNFADKFDLSSIKIGVAAFSDKMKICCEATSDRRKLMQAIDGMTVGMVGEGNETEPLTELHSLLCPYKGEPFVYVIVLTDGVWSRYSCQRALHMKQKYIDSGFEIVALGFGNADESFLKHISTRSELAAVDSLTLLDSRLANIARVINEKTIE